MSNCKGDKSRHVPSRHVGGRRISREVDQRLNSGLLHQKCLRIILMEVSNNQISKSKVSSGSGCEFQSSRHTEEPVNTWPWIFVIQLLSHAQLFATAWTVACQAPLSMGLPRQESWSGLPFSSPGDLPDLGIPPMPLSFPALQADALPLSHQGSAI